MSEIRVTTYEGDSIVAEAIESRIITYDGVIVSGGGGGAVDSVNGQTGVVVLDAADVGALPDTYTPPAPDAPTWDEVTGKPTTFAPSTHTHAYADITGTPSIPDSPDDIGAAAASHTHAQSDVTGLAAALDGKADDADLAAHLNDTTDAHDASAISFAPTGTIAATDVQSAIAEVASEASSAGALPKMVELATNLSLTSTAYQTVLSATFTPTGNSAMVSVTGVGAHSAANALVAFQVSRDGSGTTSRYLGSPSGSAFAGSQFGFACRRKFTDLTPGTPYTFNLQAKVFTGTFHCRPASFPENEELTFSVEDCTPL